MATADVVFVAPPFYSLARPSLALGILQALCRDRGISCKSIYANLYFSTNMPLTHYEEICELGANTLFGEWLFSRQLFPGTSESNDQDYLRHAKNIGVSPSLISSGLEVRKTICDYVRQMTELILGNSPKIVGFTTTFQQTMASLAMARTLRALRPDIILCIGGANCDSPMGDFLADHFDYLDHVFVGEGEHSFVEFIELAARTKFDRAKLREAKGKVIKGNALRELPRYPSPRFGDYFESLTNLGLRSWVEPSIPFESSRGCWWGEKHHCTFCGLNGTNMAFRARAASDVVSEIADHVRTYQVECFHAVDNILSTDHLKDLLPAIRDQFPDCVYFYEVKSNLKRPQLELLASANVIWVQPGIESLKDDALRLMKKGVAAVQNLRFLRDCQELGIYPVWNWLFGFPGEDFADTIDEAIAIIGKITHLVPPNGPIRIRLDRYSPNFDKKGQDFANVRPFVDYRYIFPGFSDKELERYAYFFSYEGWDAEPPPGIIRLRNALQKWRDRSGKRAPVLRMFDLSADAHLIIDTRRSTMIKFIDGLECRVLKSVREPMSRARVLEHCRDADAKAVEAAIRSLVGQDLIVECGGLYVSIVCEDADRASTSQGSSKNPLGHVKSKPSLGLFEPLRQSTAASARHHPHRFHGRQAYR
jgi:ribosomal peptide maturation radical SAM protein 1